MSPTGSWRTECSRRREGSERQSEAGSRKGREGEQYRLVYSEPFSGRYFKGINMLFYGDMRLKRGWLSPGLRWSGTARNEERS